MVRMDPDEIESETDAPNILLLETAWFLNGISLSTTSYGFNEIDIKDFVELLTKFPIKRDAFRMKMHWVSKYSQILRVWDCFSFLSIDIIPFVLFWALHWHYSKRWEWISRIKKLGGHDK